MASRSTWNDNNEFEIVDPKARAHGFGAPHQAIASKPLQTLHMLRVSREAQIAYAPDKRPYLVSRSGSAGMQRYVQTWSGDNYTSWETLKYNIRMGLGLALSGISNTGHDVGGFDGPPPDAELFCRWVEFGIFMPRFSIHSWNSDGTANEPWMHPGVTGHVRDLIKLRYRFLPYLYDLTWKYASACEPIIRPTFLEFPDDPNCFAENDDLLLGPSLLVAAIVEPGATSRDVYLPAGSGWYDYWSGELFSGGRTITRTCPLGRPTLMVRQGSVIALNTAEQHFRARADCRAFQIFPPSGFGKCEAAIFEDDGESDAWRSNQYRLWHVRVRATPTTLEVSVIKVDQGIESGCDVEILLPAGENRIVTIEGGHRTKESTH